MPRGAQVTLTAYGLVHLGARIEAGQTVLIHAAGGGVGLLAVQMAKRAGARVLGTVSNAAKAEAVRAVGGETLEYGEDLARRVLDATDGRGVDVVLDSVGRATQDVSLEVLARFGLLLFYGDASGPPLPIDPDRLYERSLKIGSYTLDVNHRPELWREARQELLRWVEEGSLRLTISAGSPAGRRGRSPSPAGIAPVLREDRPRRRLTCARLANSLLLTAHTGRHPGRPDPLEEKIMSVAKIIEISADSDTSFDDAIREGIRRASKTIKQIKGAWVQDQQVDVENNEIVKYRVHLKVTFVLE